MEDRRKRYAARQSLCERAHLYIWDEPLNFIDVISRMQIEKLLIEHNPINFQVRKRKHDSTFCRMLQQKQFTIVKVEMEINMFNGNIKVTHNSSMQSQMFWATLAWSSYKVSVNYTYFAFNY